jgi:hypothetical protein
LLGVCSAPTIRPVPRTQRVSNLLSVPRIEAGPKMSHVASVNKNEVRGDVVFCGWMMKRTRITKKWKQQWIILDSTSLFYGDDAEVSVILELVALIPTTAIHAVVSLDNAKEKAVMKNLWYQQILLFAFKAFCIQ